MDARPLLGIFAVVVFFAASFLWSGFTIIESGNIGVRSTLGNIDREELTAGWHWVLPMVSKIERVFTKTVMVNYSTTEGQKADSEEILYESTLMGEDKTGLSLGIDLTVEVKPIDNMMAEMFVEVGRSGFDKMVIQTIRSVARRVISNYSAESIMTLRKEVESDIEKELQKEYEQNKYYKLVNAQLKQIVLPPKIREAIEVVAIRKQEAAAAEQAIKSREAEARSAMEVSKGRAEASKIEAKGQAESVLIKAEAEAKANEMVAKSITGQILARDWIEAWKSGGSHVPAVVGGSGSGQSLMLDISEYLKKQ